MKQRVKEEKRAFPLPKDGRLPGDVHFYFLCVEVLLDLFSIVLDNNELFIE